MGWVARDAEGNDVPFNTHEEAVAYEQALAARETRTPDDIWASAEKPRVSRETFLRRMAMGWTGDRALYTTPDGRYLRAARGKARTLITEQMGASNAGVHEVAGRMRTLAQWSASCGLSVDQLYGGVRRYGTLATYFEHVGWYPDKHAEPEPE